MFQDNDLPDGFNFYSSSLASRVYQEEGDDEIDLWIKVIHHVPRREETRVADPDPGNFHRIRILLWPPM